MRDRMSGPETGLFFLHNAQQLALTYEGGGLLDGPSLFMRSISYYCTSRTQYFVLIVGLMDGSLRLGDLVCVLGVCTCHRRG